MKKKTWFVWLVLALLAAGAAVCYFFFRPQTAQGMKHVTVQVTHLDGTEKEFFLETEAEYLGQAMLESGLLEGEDGQYGLYILAVDGEFADESKQQWWGYTKGGAYVEYGADCCVIQDGDHYEFVLHEGW